jgi:2-oxo-4-hydroxy-4-carboxy-5-ureidoimidazoline decarboxylase
MTPLSPIPLSLSQLNQLTESEFTDALAHLFEQTPTIATATWHHRPFTSLEHLHEQMVAIVQTLSPEAQHALICAHPDLGSRIKMAAASVQEQSGAGLDRLSPEEYETFQTLNTQYKTRFQFPFIIAVKGHNPTSILHAFQTRLHHDPATEFTTALTQIAQIAWFRLQDRVTIEASSTEVNSLTDNPILRNPI